MKEAAEMSDDKNKLFQINEVHRSTKYWRDNTMDMTITLKSLHEPTMAYSE